MRMYQEDIVDKEAIEHLESIEEELKDINSKTITPKRALLNGVMQGLGAVIGSIAAVALLGWLLHVFGLIPGLSEFAAYFEELIPRN